MATRPPKVRAQHAARVREWRVKDRARKAVTAAIFGPAWDDEAWRGRLDVLIKQGERIAAERQPAHQA